MFDPEPQGKHDVTDLADQFTSLSVGKMKETKKISQATSSASDKTIHKLRLGKSQHLDQFDYVSIQFAHIKSYDWYCMLTIPHESVSRLQMPKIQRHNPKQKLKMVMTMSLYCILCNEFRYFLGNKSQSTNIAESLFMWVTHVFNFVWRRITMWVDSVTFVV